MKKNILFLLSLCLVMLSCQKETVPSLTINQPEVSVTNAGGFQIIYFESNMSWTAKSSESWCVINSPSGDESINTIVLNIAKNESNDARICTVTIMVEGLSKTLTINQSANAGLLVTKDKYDLSNDASTIEVEVKANIDFDVTISGDWIKQVNTRGLNSTKLSFEIDANKSYDNRSGKITIKQKNGPLTSTVIVYQSQKDAIILTNKTQNLANESQTLEVELKTNIDFEVIIPAAAKNWVSYLPTRGLRTETLKLYIAYNENYDARSTEIYVKNKATSLQDTLTINQGSNFGILVTPDKYDLNNDATTIEVEVKANVEFDVTIVGDWITKVATRGLTSTTLQFNIAKNSSYDSRNGSITIKQKNGPLSSTIKVYQSQKDAIIISNKTENISNDAQKLDVELKTNVDYEVIIPIAAKSWVSYTPTRGLRTETLILDIAKNENYDTRTTQIYVKNKATNLQDTLTINQSSNLGLIVTPDKYDLNNDATTIEVEVKANVEFDVTIVGDWITKVATRGLTTTKIQFNIAKNTSYDNRNGSITIKQKGGALSSTINVYQSQKDAIIISNKTENITNDAQKLEVELKTNVDYEVIIPQAAKSWVSYTPTRGLRTETLSLNINKNEEYTIRTTEIYVKNKATSLQDTLTINQAANLGFFVTPDKFELSNDATIIEVNVEANFELDVTLSDDWITKVNTRGLTNTKLYFNIAKNKSYDNRNGTITIKQKNGSLTKIIKVYQSQEDAIIISNKQEDISSNSQTIDVEVKTNVDFEVIIPEAAKSWVSYTPTRVLRTENLLLNIAKNEGYNARTTEIYVKNRATSLQDTLTINQRANLGFFVSPDKFDLNNDASTIEVNVDANFEFDVIISDSWITSITTRGLTSTKLSFNIAKNRSYDNRVGSITIRQKDGPLTETIKVYQSQEDAIILSEKTENISNESQILKVELKTNVDFEVIIPESAQSWVSYTPTRALRTDTLSLNIAANEDYDARTTEVYIKNKVTSLQDTLTINQNAKLGLSLSHDKFDLNNDATTIEVDVAANFEFDVIISDSWITSITTRGLTSTKLSFNIAKNTSYDSRVGTITIKQRDGILQKTIKINQSQEDAIILSKKTENLSNESQILKVELNTNVDFEVIIPEAAKSWVSYTPTRAFRTDTLMLNITANESYDARTTEVYVKNKATSLQDTLTITQSATLGFEIIKDKYDLSDDATSIEVEVKANFEYDVIITDDWISNVTTRSLPSSKLQFNIAKNSTYDNRVGTITIKQKNGILQKTIKVNQSQKDAIIISKKREDLSSDSQTLKVELKTNVDFEVIIPAAAKSWVSYTPTRGLRTDTLLLNIAMNIYFEPRTAKVYVKNKTTSLQDTLTIYQGAYLVLPKVTTNSEVTSITRTTAVSGGNITDDGGGLVIARGVCWSTNPTPNINDDSKTKDGTGAGSFTSEISNLEPGTTYYVRAYATNNRGTSYGSIFSFKTVDPPSLPIVTTTQVTEFSQTSAVSGGNITNDGEAPIIARGVCWNTSGTPTIDNSEKTDDGTGAGIFTSNLLDLLPGTTYNYRAYATNSRGTGYGLTYSFTTKPL